MMLDDSQTSLQCCAEVEPPDLGVCDGAHVVNVVTGANLADDEIIEESLFEHVSEGTPRSDDVPDGVAFTEDLYSDVR